MGENAICTKQTNEDGGENRKGKIHLKGTFQLCLYFGDFCRGGERIGILYINKKNKWMGFNSKGAGIEGFDKERKSPKR